MRPPRDGQAVWVVRGERDGPKRSDPLFKARSAGQIKPIPQRWAHVYTRHDHAANAAIRETAQAHRSQIRQVASWPSGSVVHPGWGPEDSSYARVVLYRVGPYWFLTAKAARKRIKKQPAEPAWVVSVEPWREGL